METEPVWFLCAASVDDWPQEVPWPTPYFTLFVVSDREIDANELATRALAQGLAGMSAWGPGCSSVHDAFDDAIVDAELAESNDEVILTTWHERESVDEALFFFLDLLTVPASRSRVTYVVFAIGDAARIVERAFAARGERVHRVVTSPSARS